MLLWAGMLNVVVEVGGRSISCKQYTFFFLRLLHGDVQPERW